MAKTYKTYEQLEEIARTTNAALRTVRDLDTGLLTNKGYIQLSAWDYVYDAFVDCTCETELIEWMRANISSMNEVIEKSSSFELKTTHWDLVDTKKFLRKYVRINFPRSLWENIDEFTK